MHDVLTTSPAPQTYFYNTQDDLLPAINLTTRHQTTDIKSWHESDSNQSSETWPPKQDDSHKPVPFTRSSPAGFQKQSHHSKMSSLSESKPSGNNHWLFNSNGQLVDVESDPAGAGWDLADEIVRLKIGDVAGQSGEDAALRTPPKKLTSSISQLSETSPLESPSANSIDSSPPSDHQIISHSRGSSTDTTESSSHDSIRSGASNTLLSNSLNATPPKEPKERPHSYSGGLSNADLRHLQSAGDGTADGSEQQWSQYREPGNDQLSYPSLTSNTVSIHRPQPQVAAQIFDYRAGITPQGGGRDDLQIVYNLQQRNFNPLPSSGMTTATQGATAPSYVQRPTNGVAMQYRQPVRGYPQQPGLLPSPPAMGYPGGHTAHMSLGNSQQLYDMMLPPSHDNPAVSRIQQQAGFAARGAHHHSASDPSTLREPQLSMMSNSMPFAAPGMYPAGMAPPPSMAMYPNQFYGQETYPRGDPAMNARIQSQYSGPYGMVAQSMDGGMSSPTSVGSGQNGPSANNRKLGLYKTELCRSWEEKGSCRYGAKCQFAHGEEELRKVQRHPKYKTEICRTFWVSGSCPYGKRCCFIHTELPTQGGAIPQDAPTPPQHPDGRARSMSTNSDPNEGGVSLLARISAKRGQDSTTPVDGSNGYQYSSRPPTGSLRVDTSALDQASMKQQQQNKSAYPSFAGNGVLLSNVDHKGTKSPAPVTAGPDLGRHNDARIGIVGHGYNQRATPPSNATSGHSYTLSSGENAIPSQRGPGHVRAGSAGNWANLSRSGHLSSASFSHGPSATANETLNSPWSTTELTMGGRLHEKAWA